MTRARRVSGGDEISPPFCLVSALAALFSWPAQAVPQCAPRAVMLQLLLSQYRETPAYAGMSNRGWLVEVWTTADGDGETWSIISTSPRGVSCINDAGEGWRGLPQPEQGQPL